MNRIQLRACSATLAFALLGGCAFSPQARHDKYLARGKALLEKHDYSRAILEFRNAAKAMPKDAEAYYQIGLASEESGDVRTAVAFYRKALLENPKHAGAQLKLAQLMALTTDKGLLQDAENRLNILKQSSPASPDVLNSLALTELKLGRPDDAIDALEAVLANAPGELTSSILLARTKMSQHDVKGAEEVLINASAAAPKSATPRAILGEFYILEKKPAEAEIEFQRALAIDPKSGPALLDLANLQRSLGRKQEAEQSFKRAAALGEERYKPVYGQFLFAEGRRDEAVREFERLAKQDPDDRLARTRLIAVYRAVNRTADAQRILDEALNRNPRDLDALLQRAEIFLGGGKYQQAETDLNEVLHLRPNSGEAHYIMAKLNAARGEKLSYRHQLSEALRLNPYLVAVRLALAQSLIAGKQASAALEVLNAAPADQKQLTSVLVERNWALWASGDLAEMRKGIDQGLSRERSPELLVQEAAWELRNGKAAEARAVIDAAVKADPTNLRAVMTLKAVYGSQKQLGEGVKRMREAAATQPKSAVAQDLLGSVLLSSGDRVGARAAFEAANKLDPSYAQADMSLAKLDVLEGKFDDAAAKLNSVLSRDPHNSTARLWLGEVEYARGHVDEAVANFQAAVDVAPRNTDALNNLAYLLAEYRKQPDVALKYAQTALEIAPDNPQYADTVGWTLYKKGLYDMAVQQLERSVSLGGSATSSYHLAMAYAKAGNAKRARTVLDTALAKYPNAPEVKTATEVVGQASASR